MTFAGEGWNSLDPGLVAYLVANQGSARYLVVTPTSSYASLFILATGKPAMALGGYQGWDRILTPEQLAGLVADGTVRFFYLSGGGALPGGFGGPGGQDATADLTVWVRASCTAVPAQAWQSGPTAAGSSGFGRGFAAQGQQLYDCAAPAGPAT
jgi:hypothetical protein